MKKIQYTQIHIEILLCHEKAWNKAICRHTDGPWEDHTKWSLSSAQCSSVAQSCLTLCDPMDCSTPGLPVHHQLPEFTQTHVHRVGDAIQPSHPLSSPSPPAFNLSQHQGLFQWVSSSHQVAKVLEFQLQYQSFQWTPRTDLLYNGLIGSPCSPRDSQQSSPTPQFKSINSSVLSFLHSPTLLLLNYRVFSELLALSRPRDLIFGHTALLGWEEQGTNHESPKIVADTQG